MLHSFISYNVPVTVTRPGMAAQKSLAAGADPALQTAGTALDSLKQMMFGNASNDSHANHGSASRTGYITQPCILTTGETWAIWMNVLYLAPLTYLFVSFFITSYLKRTKSAIKATGKSARRLSNNVAVAEKAGWDAARSVEREVYGAEKMMGSDSAISEEDSPAPTPTKSKARRKA